MFSQRTLDFLAELSANNNRDWFAANKTRYEQVVREPALAYIDAMQAPLGKLSPYIQVSAKKTGGSLMRVYRDTRFSADKTPYKTNIGIHFRHVRGRDVHAPGLYLHLESDDAFIGGGIWHPDNASLTAMRTLMDEHPKDWKKLKLGLGRSPAFELAGDSLKRPPRGFSADHPLIEDLKRKDFVAIHTLPVEEMLGKDIVKLTTRLFRRVAPLMAFICDATDLDFSPDAV